MPSGPVLRMHPDGPRQTLLDELEVRQNELLDELDRLNHRIEQVLREGLKWRGEQPSPAAMS